MLTKLDSAHAQAMVAIYNEAILEGGYANCDTLHHDTRAFTDTYFRQEGGSTTHAVLGYVDEQGQLLAWGTLKALSTLPHDHAVAEVAVYVSRRSRFGGMGKALLAELIVQGEARGLHSLIAIVLGKNNPSIRGCLSSGFSLTMQFPGIARQGDERVDILWLQRRLDRAGTGA